LGDGTTTNRSTPIRVKGPVGDGTLTDTASISMGDSFMLALQLDGTALGWGYNGNGQLGNNSNTSSDYPVQVVGPGGVGLLSNLADISAAVNFGSALDAIGRVFTWGYNGNGQLGDGTTTGRTTPVQVVGSGGAGFLTDIVEIGGSGSHKAAITS